MATPTTYHPNKRPRRVVSDEAFIESSHDNHIAEPREKKPRLPNDDDDDDHVPIPKNIKVRRDGIGIGIGRDGPGKKHPRVGSSTTTILEEPLVTTSTTSQLRLPHRMTSPPCSMTMVDKNLDLQRQASSLSVADSNITLNLAADKEDFGLGFPTTRKAPVAIAIHIHMDMDIAAARTSTKQKPPKIHRRACSFFQTISILCACATLIWFGIVARDEAFSSSSPVVQIHNPPPTNNCIYVPGAGFSGFWFTLGRLQSLPDPLAETFYCYSAGCLAAVSTLNGFSMEQVSTLARTLQHEWATGQTSRYHVVPKFVDGLVVRKRRDESSAPHPNNNNNNNMLDTDTYPTTTVVNTTTTTTTTSGTMARDDEHPPAWLSQLKVITTKPNHKDGWGVQTAIRTPTSMADLRKLLVQTAWIPLVTGDELLYQGHMDGAFDTAHHPKCDKTLGLPADWVLISNILNVNLDKASLERLWRKGMAYGV
jgi:hypothetical protein